MKLRKIIAAAMALTVVCGAQTAVTSYQPAECITANAADIVDAVPTDIVDSGTCGDNLTWELDTVGTLTISGTGEMDYAPWRSKYKDEIKSVIISEGVTSIGPSAFEECSALTSITIPDGVTIIADRAFCECSELVSITIPDSLTTIGDDAFVCCSKLTSINIPNGVTSIGADAFDECSGLTAIIIPDSVTNIGYAAFYRCSGLTSITIPDGVTTIGDWTFYECPALTSITLPDSVTSISDKAIKDNSDVTIYGYEGSRAESYAKEKGIPFVAIEKSTTTTATTISTTTTTTTTTTTVTTPEVPLGDPTGDGRVDSKDATFVLVEYALRSTDADVEPLPTEIEAAADVNRDGLVDARDASAILRYYSYVSTGGTDTIEAFLQPQEK